MALPGSHRPSAFSPLVPLLLTTLLYGCGGEVEIDDGIVTALDCAAQVAVPDNGEGLTTNANYQGLHYYALGTNLCAFDPGAGTAFEVDRTASDALTPAFTLYSEDSGGASIQGLVYIRDNHLRFTPTGQHSASAPPSPRQISSEDRADEVSRLFAGFDRSDSDRVSIAYRLPMPDGVDEWFATELSDTDTVAPTPFGTNRRPLGPVNSADGQLTGWILHDSSAEKDDLVLVSIDNVNEDEQTLKADLNSASVNFMVQLDSGGSIIAVVRPGETEFFHLDPGTSSVTSVGSIPAEVDGTNSAFATNGEVLYVAQTVSDAEGDNQARLYRVDTDPAQFREIDRASQNDTVPAQVTTTDFAVAWAWNTRLSLDGPSGVFLVQDDAEDAVTTIRDNAASDNNRVFSSLARGSQENRIYFTERNKNTGGAYRAFAVNTTQPDTPDIAVEMENARWVGSSQPAGVHERIGVTPPARMSEVFLTRLTTDGAELLAFDAGNPGVDTGSVVLGPVRSGTSSRPPAPSITAFGLGPHRVIQTGNDLRVLDSRHSDSLRTLATESSFQPVIETFPGF